MKFKPVVSILLLSLSCLIPLIAHAADAEPQELLDARKNYSAEVKKALKPINDRYLPKLEQLKKDLTLRGDLKGALAVEQQIESMATGQTSLTQQGDNQPSELSEITKNRSAEVQNALKSVSSLYLAKLEVLKQEIALSGSLKGALAVEREIDNVKQTATFSGVYERIGCFKDQGNPFGTAGRDISGFVVNNPSMTTEMCTSICRGKAFSYAGTQYGTWCFCGNSYGKFGTAGNCNMPCGGNQTERCGGVWANEVYRVR